MKNLCLILIASTFTLSAQTLLLPHLTRDGGGFTTTLFFKNTTESNVTITLQPYQKDGTPRSIQHVTVPANTFLNLPAGQLFETSEAISHLQVSNAGGIDLFLSYVDSEGQGSPAHLQVQNQSSAVWEVFGGNWEVVFDGLACVNVGNSEASLSLLKVSFEGQILERFDFESALPPMAKTLFVLGSPDSNSNPLFNACDTCTYYLISNYPVSLTSLRGTPPGSDLPVLWENPAIPRIQSPEPEVPSGFFVSTSGDDSADGSVSSPWRTIQHAADVLGPGDTVTVSGGTYGEQVRPQTSGQPDKPITYRSAIGETVILDGSDITLAQHEIEGLFDLTGRDYIRVQGFTVQNVGPYQNNVGILAQQSNHVQIEGCKTYNTTSSGIASWNSSHITITENEVELACNGGEQECITVAITESFEVSYNHIHHAGLTVIGGEGLDAKDGSSNGSIHHNRVHHLQDKLGIYIDAWDKHTHDIDVFQNIVYENGSDGIVLSSESGGLLERIQVFNNLVFDNSLNGIILSAFGESPTHPMSEISIINNSFVNNGNADWGGGLELESQDLSNITIRNNIFSENQNYQILNQTPSTSLHIDHNLIFGYRGTMDEETRGVDFIEGNPLFLDPTNGDYHLGTGSPAIDAGSSLAAPPIDYEGNQRPQGDGIDIGAFEKTP